MPPLTLTILASVLKLHGPDAAISKDHRIYPLLGEVPGQLSEQGSSPLQPGAKREGFVVNEDDKPKLQADDDLKNVRDHKKAQAIKPTNTKPSTSGSSQTKGRQ